jgi:hypothetical protein
MAELQPSAASDVVPVGGYSPRRTAGRVVPRGATARLVVAPPAGGPTMDAQRKRDLWFIVAMAVAITVSFAVIEAW